VRGVVLSVALLPAALFAAGCGDDDSSTASGTVATGAADTGALATTPASTADIDPATGLPRSFPDEFPVIEGSTVSRASEYADRYVIEWRSDESYEDAEAFYEGELAEDPWTTDSASAEGEATVFEFSGGVGAGYTGTLAVATLDEGSRILLELHPVEPS